MLIIFGVSELLLDYYENDNIECQECSKQQTTYRVIQKYLHMFWIPFFPTEKYTAVNCDNCSYKSNNIVSELSKEYEKFSKAPLYLYSGSIIASILLIFFIVLIADLIFY